MTINIEGPQSEVARQI